MKQIRKVVLASASAMALSTPAWAQDEASADEASSEEIVVTGTLVRGVEPTGSKVIGINRSAVEATGASTVTQLLQTVPQFASFGGLQAPTGGGNSVTTNRPNLRNLQAANSNGSSTTLMMVDGHRIVGMGILQTSPDLDTIAPGAIERVEIVPDGGSAIYGADAVGGVLNFITRKTFDGIAVDGRFGFADNYQTWDANATIGKSWDGGGIYVSYNYSQHDPIYGIDRDWVRTFPTLSSAVAFPVTALTCPTPNIQILSGNTPSPNVYGLPLTPTAGAKLNQPNQCDLSDFVTIYPKERRHAVFASLTQDLSDSLSFELKGFFMDRTQRQGNGIFTSIQNVGTGSNQLNSPYRANYIINNAAESHRVSFGWGGVDAVRQEVHLRAWGVTPTFTAKFGDNWRARLMLNYGESDTLVHSPTFNTTALTEAIKAGLFNPYNPTDPATNNAAALAVISNWETFGQAKQSQLQARAILDGELFQLPGGGAKVAVGVEYMRETLRTQKGDVIPGAQNFAAPAQVVNGVTLIPAASAGLPIFRAGRNVKSVFGEIVAPILADAYGFKELTLSVSGRFDSYSDAGDTFNPKIGLTWKPVDYLRFRAQWGRSFAAPSLANAAKTDPASASWGSGQGFTALVNAAGIGVLTGLGYAAPTGANQNVLLIRGGSDNLKPQKAETWSVGGDLDPFPGARLSLTYWNIKFRDFIAQPGFSNPVNFFQNFQQSYVIIPSLDTAAATALIANALASTSSTSGTPCSPQPQCVYVVEFANTQNLGKFQQAGFDFSASYTTNTSFGSIDFNTGGTYILHRRQSVSATAPLIDQIPLGFSRLRLRTSLGAQIDKLRAQVVWNHTAGFSFTPTTVGVPGFYPDQSEYGAFDTVDLFFKYDFGGAGATKDLSLTLGVSNVFDADPPVRYLTQPTPSQNGYVNGSTVGRLVQLGFSKKF